MSNIFSTTPKTVEVADSTSYPAVGRWLGMISSYALGLVVFLAPIIFCLKLSDAIELSKQTVLLPIILVSLLAWMGKSLAERSLTIKRHWMHMMVGLFGLGYALTAIFSQDRALSLFGANGQVAWAFSTVLGMILMYLVIVQTVKSTTSVYNYLLTFMGGSALAALFGILQLANVHVLGGVFMNKGITTVGSAYSLATFLVVPLLLAVGLVYHGCRNKECLLGRETVHGTVSRVLVWVSGLLSFAYIVMVDYWLTWAAVLLGTVVMVGVALARTRKLQNPVKLALPASLMLVAALLFAFNSPLSAKLPAEVTPNAVASFEITKQALRDNALFGTGPGTWIYNYSMYRNQLVNETMFWNIRFDRGYSTFLTLLATTGVVGVALWLLLIVSLLVKAATKLTNEKDEDAWYAYLVLFSAFISLIATSFFTHFNMVHVVTFWFILSLLTALVAKDQITWDKNANGIFTALSIKTVIVGVASFAAIWLMGQRAYADMQFVKAVSDFRANQPIDSVITKIESASKLNPTSDVYVRNLAQAYLVKAAKMIQAKPATEAEQQQVTAHIKKAVDTAALATRVNPRNVDNWSNLALMFQSVMRDTRGANEEVIKNFKEASNREPQNPVYLTEIGKVYLLTADAYRSNINSTDAVKKAEAEKGVKENLALAESFLSQAIQAKRDYLPAYYQRGVVYERQQRTKEAINELKTVLVNAKDKNESIVGIAFELSILLYRDGQKADALTLLDQVVKQAPENINARWYLSALLEEKGDYAKAIETLKPIAEKYPDSEALKQRVNALTAAQASKEAPKPATLPEPIPETIQNQQNNNPVKP